jgi:hypothetical protein
MDRWADRQRAADRSQRRPEEPALGIYLYTSNYLDGSISAGQLSANTGQLSGVANSPFPTGIQPVCLTAVANGPHSSQLVTQ